MKELFVHMANAMPLDQLLDELEKAIKTYRMAPTEGNLSIISTLGGLISTKQMLETKSTSELIDDLHRSQRGADLLKENKN